jgi:hypothetical protein
LIDIDIIKIQIKLELINKNAKLTKSLKLTAITIWK